MYRSKNKFLDYLAIDIKTYDKIVSELDSYYKPYKKVKLSKRGKALYRNGKLAYRTICPSTGQLKTIQKKIDKLLKKDIIFPKCHYGGVKGKCNIRNAKFHMGMHYFLVTDLRKYFPHIKYKMIYNQLTTEGYSSDVSRMITRLCTLNGKLPQGIPPATTLANMISKPLCEELTTYIKGKGIIFSVFVDDITFSSNSDFKSEVPAIIGIIESHNFRINHKKTHYKIGKATVTGLNVRQNRITPSSHIWFKINNQVSNEKREILSNYMSRIKKA